MKMIYLGLVISMLGLVGCGGSKAVPTKNASPPLHAANSDKQSEEKVAACSLLTKTDAESFLGETVAEPATSRTEAMGNIATQCRYSTASGKRVGLLTRQAATSDQAAKVFQQARAASNEISGAAPQVISGLGDEAYWTGGNLKQLNLLKSDVWLIITASPGNGIDPLDASKTVARKILDRMP
jgi:hypothetical protein